MSDMIYVLPVEGRTVKDPRTRQPIPPEGLLVPDEPHWQQLVHFGDLTVGEAPDDAAPSPAEKA